MATLPPGARVGAYEVVSTIGAGGMGQVLRARDVALHREVALKILPADLAGDDESRSRLEREARVLASLNHPHIAQVYGLEQSAAGPAIAMELVEGLTLRDHMRKGLSRDEALRLAQHIAMGLDAAHEKGIIHRDLKPGNIMVTPEGIAKVLDFGLAKAAGAAAAAEHETTLAATVEGAVVGTPAYMSPEQARGHAVDRRTDIWAFGCILYELFAGRPPFSGETASDLAAAIIEREPDWRALPSDTPPHLQRLIQRCLQKDRRARLRDIGDALHEITSPGPVDAVATSPGPAAGGRILPFALVAVVALALGGVATWLATRGRDSSASVPAMVRLELPAPAGFRFGSTMSEIEMTTVAISPDGSTLAFVASRTGEAARIWVRPLGDANAREIAGTDNAISVFFSPDGQTLGFFAAGQLKRVAVAGGAPLKVCDVPVGVGLSGSWGRQGDILFATVQGERLWRVPAGGGTPVDAIAATSTTGRTLWPRHLPPDGRRFLYSNINAGTPGQVVLVDADGERTTLFEATSQVQWVDPHWVLFVREGTLLAQRVDLSARRTVGEPVAVLGSVAYSLATGWSNVAASPTGTIVARWHLNEQRLAWFDSNGVERTAVSRPAGYLGVRLAPDDGALLLGRLRPELGNFDIWKIDVARGSEEPITNTPEMEAGQVWVPGGQAVVYAAARGGAPTIHHRDLATGVERRLTTSRFFQISNDVTPDGTVIYQQRTETGTFDLMSVSISDPQEPKPIITSTASEEHVRLQPGGKLMSYTSDESGRPEIYLLAFPPAGSRIPASTSGGLVARWRRDGRELFFLSPERRLMAVPIDAAGKPGQARVLFDARNWVDYDVARDGRFIAIVSQKVGAEQPLAVILNWRQ
jgi:Tol biopolymer transport system component/predicted Ser/Thr protein kinase